MFASAWQTVSIIHMEVRMVRPILLLALFVSTSSWAQGTPPPGCDSPESHQFDFWVGKWEVHPRGSDKIIAHSLIEKRYAGCAVRENWMPLGKELSGGGGSLSLYDMRRKQWRQTWVDSSGTRVDLDGGFANGVMLITGNWENFVAPGKDALVRMSYQVQPNGEVRQRGESSTDGGKKWSTSFDFLYRRVQEFPAF
ncbi:hypothetical protein GCM10022276_03430 [Sphingomonas limnosediminicola]|uniref:DUF1579 domain-containing protein n=1 Tax=Sphingomonas limnosediminicola TaxID=940133 RepID=A0ABP7KXT3_9SPHN